MPFKFAGRIYQNTGDLLDAIEETITEFEDHVAEDNRKLTDKEAEYIARLRDVISTIRKKDADAKT